MAIPKEAFLACINSRSEEEIMAHASAVCNNEFVIRDGGESLPWDATPSQELVESWCRDGKAWWGEGKSTDMLGN